ncbi:MAG: translocation/assembly module TamB domain-containing protein [Candidatus Accumulibacter sp.]|nr:translocation/assembly module TamB domain-containing protein [Accumulibacter sp.]
MNDQLPPAEPPPAPDPPAGGESPLPAAAPRRRLWRWRYLPVAAWLLTAALVSLLVSETGLRLLCRLAEGTADGQLTIEPPSGSLAGSFIVPALRWRDHSLDVKVNQLRVDWRPEQLLSGKLALVRLVVDTLRVAHLGSDVPTSPPASLRLPLAVDIELLQIGLIELADHALPDGAAKPIAADFSASLSSAAGSHRLGQMHAQVGQLTMAGEASLAADPPFQLAARAELNGEAVGRPLRFVLNADGPLADFAIFGQARTLEARPDERFAGTMQARIAAFASQPLGQAMVHLTGVDPSAWFAGVPAATLDIDVELRPRGDTLDVLDGRLIVNNRLAGSVDQQRVPLRELRTELDVRQGAWHLAGIDARLSGNGRLRGQGTYRQGALLLDLVVEKLDAHAVHGRLRPTTLNGSLRAELALHRQSIDTSLRDPRFALAASLTVDPLTLVAQTLRLTTGDAGLEASGKMARGDNRPFELRGLLNNFDPNRFAQLPAARLNASFEMQGQLKPSPTLFGRFQLRDSRLGDQPLLGHGEIDLSGDHLRKANIDLAAAGNRLTAQGAFGKPGDRLVLRIAAPRLAPFGLAGDVDGQLVLSGSVQSPEIDANLRSTRLAASQVGEIHGLELLVRLGAGEQGVLAGNLRLETLAGAKGEVLLQNVRLTADGSRSRHRVYGSGNLPERRGVELSLEGGLAATPGGPTWTGTLGELTLSSRFDRQKPVLRLLAPWPVRLAGGRVIGGAGELQLGGGTLKLARLDIEGGRWQSAGSLRSLALLPLLTEFPALAESLAEVKSTGEPLLVHGEWDLSTIGGRRAPSGRLRLWREQGDLLIGGLPLGLTEAELAVQAASGRLDGMLRLRGRRFGELAGQLRAAGSSDRLLDPHAPWGGQLRLDVADLGWAGSLLGPAWQLAGRLAGHLDVGGTPAQPRLSGELQGAGLVVRNVDQGLRLENGRLSILLTGDQAGDVRLLLKQLTFDSVLQGLPRPLQVASGIDATALIGQSGRLEASGELRTGQADGVLNIKAERLGAWQRPEQWLLVSGDLRMKLGGNQLDVAGKLQVDAAYWEMQKKATARLSDDVVIKSAADAKPSAAARLLALNLEADLGRHFLFRGVGVDSRLAGELKIRSEGAGLPRATGTIRTVGGRFDAYGQQLAIVRGLLNFNGLIDNPGLNVRAVRANLPVEPGVEVTGTLRKPIVRLVSEPEMPDGEKLSWLVLGHSPEQQGGNESAVLLAAAQSLLGGQDGGPLKAVQRDLGIDEFAIVSGTVGGGGRRQTSRIVGGAGFAGAETTSGQIVSIGKRLATNMQISYDQSLTGAGSVVKLTVRLSRNLSLIGRAGSENALDLLWNYRFGR